MSKINQEEYEKIKLLPDYDWNWIAREKTGKILSFTNKPTKTDEVWKDTQTRLWFNYEDSQLFQFIQWEDEEPYEIAELIRECEIKELRLAPSGTVIVDSFDESEETKVKKDVKRINDELEVILDEMDELIRRAIDAETTSQTIEMLSGMTIEQVAEGFRDGKFDPKQELTMTKLETLTVPTDLGEWLQSRELGESGAYFSTIDALFIYWDSAPNTLVFDFISRNKKELIEVILGTREYRIEAPLYCALIKGHELLDTDRFYWIYDKYEESMFVSKLYSLHGNFLTEMSKSQWNELGVNDSNAEFVRVDGVEE